MGTPQEPQKGLVGQVVAGWAAIAACITAALYLAGIATLWIRMRNAGLGTQDMLPLFSLDQLLRHGLTWITPAVPALLILAVLYVATVLFERELDRRAAAFRDERAQQIQEGPERDNWVKSFNELLQRTDWDPIRTRVSDAIPHAPETMGKRWRGLRTRLWLISPLWLALISVVLFGGLFFLPLLLAIATFVVLMTTLLLLGTRPAEVGFLFPLGVVALAFVANAILNPRPLPLGTVITEDAPNGHSGDFVVSSDGLWYLGQGDGSVLLVRDEDIRCSRLTSRPRVNSLWREIAGEPVREVQPGNLECDGKRPDDVEPQRAIVVPARGKPVCGTLKLGPDGTLELGSLPEVKLVEQIQLVKRCPE